MVDQLAVLAAMRSKDEIIETWVCNGTNYQCGWCTTNLGSNLVGAVKTIAFKTEN